MNKIKSISLCISCFLLLILINFSNTGSYNINSFLSYAQQDTSSGNNSLSDAETNQQTDFGQIREQYLAGWNKTGFKSHFDAFIELNSSTGYGVYQVRESNIYNLGETINLYLEPIGFLHKVISDDQGNRFYRIGFTVDFYLTDNQGNILLGKENFLNHEHDSYNRVTEYPVDLTFDITGLSEGEYTMNIIVHDTMSGKSFELNKSIIMSNVNS